jgi:hypothetical protein
MSATEALLALMRLEIRAVAYAPAVADYSRADADVIRAELVRNGGEW